MDDKDAALTYRADCYKDTVKREAFADEGYRGFLAGAKYKATQMQERIAELEGVIQTLHIKASVEVFDAADRVDDAVRSERKRIQVLLDNTSQKFDGDEWWKLYRDILNIAKDADE